VLLLVFFDANAQQDSINILWKDVNIIKSNNKELLNSNKELKQKISYLKQTIDSISKNVQSNTLTLQKTADSLGIKISTTESLSKQKYDELGNSLSKNTLYGIIALLFAILLSVIVYFFLSKRQKTDKTEVIDQILKTKTILEEEQIKVYSKITEIHQGQLELIKQQRENTPKGTEPDHSLAKKVAEEMVKMQMNLAHMDSKIRGHRQLTIAVTNVYDNLRANGYEIIDHLNKTYNEGMNIEATMEPDPTLSKGEFIIKRVIKPEIHYNGKKIQNAQVIVSFGE
jgi:cell division septum initiation protein DivIVA